MIKQDEKVRKVEEFKRKIQNYWAKNVPGLDVGLRYNNVEEQEFYLGVDTHRFKYEPYIPSLIRSLIKPKGKLLEIGCGLGTDLREFARLEMKVYGIDLAYSNTFLTKRGLELMGLRGEIINTDAEKLPFKDNFFDVVYSFGVLHHTPDTRKAVDEILRVLVPNGTALVMLYHKGYAYYWIKLTYGVSRLKFLKYSEEEWISLKYDHTPLSKMYSKKDAEKLFNKFKKVKIDCLTFGGIQNNKKLRWIWILFNKVPFLMKNLGSFLIIRAKK